MPAKNKNPMEVFETRAYNTIGIEGGIIGPIVAVAAVITGIYFVKKSNSKKITSV